MPAADPVFQPVAARRVVATPTALDSLAAGEDRSRVCLRLAPDEVLIVGPLPGDEARSPAATELPADLAAHLPARDAARTVDPHAIDVADGGWSGARCAEDVALDLLCWATTWQVGPERPLLLQGLAAGAPVKVWLAGEDRALVLVPTPLAHDLRERWLQQRVQESRR